MSRRSLSSIRTVLLVFWSVVLPTSSASALPNLTPYQPSGWSDKIVVSRATGTHIDSTSLTATDTLYLAWAVVNNGSTATAERFHAEIYIDGSLFESGYSDPPLNPTFYSYWDDFSIGSLSAGTHTIRIRTDSTGVSAESNPSDNEYTKTITVTATTGPNLTPVQPSGWSDKIVVSNTTGTNSDTTPLTPTDTLYVDSARINNGNTATTVRFYTELYVDGLLRISFYKDPPLNPDFYSYFEDYSLGSLPAGTHTIRIKVDSTNAIAETNEADNEYTKTILVTSPSCTPGVSQLCLNGGRFRVQINWRVPSQGASGVGTAVPLIGGDTGYFWFFNSANVELMVKVLDGRGVNGKFWVFYGALSDVEYTLTVTDTATGFVKSYFNPQGVLASVADTSAFASSTRTIASAVLTAPLAVEAHVFEQAPGSAVIRDTTAVGGSRPSRVSSPFASRGRIGNATLCVPSPTALCLTHNRFSVQVSWRTPSGATGVGTAMALTSDTGYFWFFNSANVELVIKILDARTVNGKFWVFFGALSNVEYSITVTDTVLGIVNTYSNAQGTLTSRADTSAFTDDRTPAGGPLTFNAPAELPSAIVGTPFSYSFCSPRPSGPNDLCGTLLLPATNPTGGTPPYRFQLESGVGFPPMGLFLNLNGILSGTPSGPGRTSTFGICAVDLAGFSSCKTITLNASSCSYSINPTSQSLASTGGNGSVVVTAGSGCAWTATSNDNWITVNSGRTGTGNGTVTYTVAANSGASRTATMTISGQAFTVTQSAASTGSNYTYANWTCNNSSQCIAVTGHNVGSAGPFCTAAACTRWHQTYVLGTCTAQPLYTVYNAPPAGTCSN